jgi:hypothetical protein
LNLEPSPTIQFSETDETCDFDFILAFCQVGISRGSAFYFIHSTESTTFFDFVSTSSPAGHSISERTIPSATAEQRGAGCEAESDSVLRFRRRSTSRWRFVDRGAVSTCQRRSRQQLFFSFASDRLAVSSSVGAAVSTCRRPSRQQLFSVVVSVVGVSFFPSTGALYLPICARLVNTLFFRTALRGFVGANREVGQVTTRSGSVRQQDFRRKLSAQRKFAIPLCKSCATPINPRV